MIKFKILGMLSLFAVASCSSNDEVVFKNGDGGEIVTPAPTTPTTPPDNSGNPTAQTLREKASWKVGAAVTTNAIKNEAKYDEALSTHFSQLTAEYEMKMNRIWTSSSSYNWSDTDYLVDYAEANDMEVHGHTLVWYQSFPEWFKNANYDSTAFENNIKRYITDVVTRYKGRIKSWDVVNEVFADGGGHRQEGTILPIFNDPIAFYGRCFQYARDADPDAILFYNDYSVVLDSGKRAAMKRMATRFKNEGYPIDGLGDQFHYREVTSKETIKSGFADMVSTGLLMHISELDIRMNTDKSDSYTFTDAEAAKQAATYKFIVEMFEAIPDAQKFAITTWGVTDKYTWLTGWWHPKEYPLLFDREYNKKKAYTGFLEGIK